MTELSGKRVAMVLARNFEDVEATDPKEYLEKKGATLEVDATFDGVSVDQFDAMVIPGGGSPEQLRIHEGPVKFTKEFVASGKPVAAICHGAQLLISADVLAGKTITCVKTIRDDVKNAGANYVDRALVEDGNIITSRVPGDLPQFDEALGKSLSKVTA